MMGTSVGPYRVDERLGAGGMGEVYRATDTNLKRQVAIKVLPQSVANDADRLARFQREAELLASLNHPNIGARRGQRRAGGIGRACLLCEAEVYDLEAAIRRHHDVGRLQVTVHDALLVGGRKRARQRRAGR